MNNIKNILQKEFIKTGTNEKFSFFNQDKDLTVFAFYPKDNTPGCTKENNEFSSLLESFHKLNCNIYGISKDSLKKHISFKNKYEYKHDLIVDDEKILCNAFDVIREKSMFGKKYMGIDRSTFLLDKEGNILKEWRLVKVKNHVNEVLKTIENLYL